MNQKELCQKISEGGLDKQLSPLYNDRSASYKRFTELLQAHEKEYGIYDEVALFSAPGRTEIGGNHTDHQHGRVLAAAVTLDIIAAAAKTDDNLIRIHSFGHPEDIIDLSDLSPREDEKNHAASLIRGIACRMKDLGCEIGGFTAVTTSNVLTGSGLSSSAAFEVLVATIMNGLYNGGTLPMVEIAKLSQFSEREYFGKPSGLMDQTACAVGGCVAIDFLHQGAPKLRNIGFNLQEHGYSLVIVNTGANHADLTEDYASVPRDMTRVAKCFGKSFLRDVNENDFFGKLHELRGEVGDKAILRAIHFFEENERVPLMAEALLGDNIEAFFSLVKASGKSSYERLQNIYSDKNPNEQSVALALYMSERVLGDTGAYRVHGGGFAGTIQAYVKKDLLTKYLTAMEEIFGHGCCYVLDIRFAGGHRIY